MPASTIQQVLLAMSSGAAADATVSYTDTATSDADATVYTFTSRSVGTATSDRQVIVASGASNTGAPAISSITLAGNSMTSALNANATFVRSVFYRYNLTSGTTATVEVTYAGTMLRCQIGIWAMYNVLSTTPTDTGSSTSNTAGTTNLDISAGGVAIGYGLTFTSVTVRTFTWSNLTENFDASFDSSNMSGTGASAAFATAQTALAVTATPSGTTTDACYIFISYR